MSYDPKTNTIKSGPFSDFSLDASHFYIVTLRNIALKPHSPQGIKDDWKVIESWLNCEGRDLNPEDITKIKTAWKAYESRGIAPSKELQDSFNHKKGNASNLHNLPPEEVIQVFDRLLATDDQIKEKEMEKTWWRSKSREFRLWIFISVSWAILSFLYIIIFDHFGRLKYMDSNEIMMMLSIMLIPFVGGLLWFIYNRYIK